MDLLLATHAEARRTRGAAWADQDRSRRGLGEGCRTVRQTEGSVRWSDVSAQRSPRPSNASAMRQNDVLAPDA
eukprot:6128029-Prymnesium_polylepis.1